MPSTEVLPAWNEIDRLAALDGYAILDTSPEKAFDDIVRLASQLLDAPIAAVNLIAEGRQWFKSEIGLGVREMPLDDSICKVAILQSDRMVVRDARNDARFDCNPLVTSDPGLRFYAGELLKTPEGLPLGTLCVLDTKPRPDGLTEHQQFALQTLAQQVLAQLELRKIVHRQHRMLAEKEEMITELFTSRERFESIVSQAATGVVESDSDGRITLVNERYCEMLGYAAHELIGTSVASGKASESAGQTLDALHRLATGEKGIVFESRYRRKDGSHMWSTTSMSALRDQQGQLQGSVAIVMDITENKQTEEDLRGLAASLAEADYRKTEFLATLAHELRNPLAPIRTGLDVLRLRGDSPEAVGKIREMMERQVLQMVHLVDDLLDIARISGGKVVLQKSLMPLAKLMSDAVETSMPLIDNGHHQLVTTLPDESLVIDADPTRIAQILANLLNNAAKYTPAGGRIELSAHREDDTAVIVVTDNGVGIPEESLPKIFDMFNQVGESLSRSQGGLGIGLSLVRRMVEMHGGSVLAKSDGAGTGSTFTLRLPIAHVAAG